MKKSIISLAFSLIATSAFAQHYSLTWNNFNTKDDTKLEILGKLETKPSDGTGNSYWSVGCETLDRDFGIFSEYKEHIGKLGVGYARIQSGWAKCEPEKGKYNFGWLDEIVNGLIEQGVKPWMCLCYGNPAYNDEGSDLGSAIFTSDTAYKGWCKYVEAIVRRYKGKITMYEVWNEPNLHQNKQYPDRYAKLYIETCKIIKKADPSVKLAGLSLSGSVPLDFAENVLELLKEMNGLEYLEYATFHPYYPNPDDATSKIEALRTLVHSYNPKTILLQGETGCPSVLEWGHALSYREWSEYSQVKWIMRRMANDFKLGIPSSIFTMIDLQYKNMLQSFGLIRMNLLKQCIYKRPSYYGVMHMANLLTIDMKPYTDSLAIESSSAKKISFSGIKQNDKPIGLMLWFGDNVPDDSISKEKTTVTVNGITMKHPVLVDPITGRVYSLKNVVFRGGNEVGKMKFTNLPMWDSPLIIIEKEYINIIDTNDSAIARDSAKQESFI